MVKMQFYNDIHTGLSNVIRHYWYVEGTEKDEAIYELLPMDHVDMVINAGQPFKYNQEIKPYQPSHIHFHGIKNKSVKVIQSGNIQALGISFTPWGGYFLVRETMGNYMNQIVNLREVNVQLYDAIHKLLEDISRPSFFIRELEKILVGHLRMEKQEAMDCAILEEFISSHTTNIKNYCEQHHISHRKLERDFRKYIGMSPKGFMNITRFEESARDVMYHRESNFTEISYKHGYYDQPHFTKIFKGYTTYGPRKFQDEQPALKSHMQVTQNYPQEMLEDE